MPSININVHIPPELDKLIHAAIAEKLAEMQEQFDRVLAVVDAARAVHDGASVETRRAALERLGAALQAYDEGSRT